MTTVETARLVGAPVTRGDLTEFRSLFQDEQVACTMAGKRTDAEVAAIVERDVEHWERHGYGMWAWRCSASGMFVARGGLRTVPLLGRVETEVGYAVMPRWWRQGFATEIATFSVGYAFAQAGLDALVSMTLPTNEGSRRVMAKAGFTYDRGIVHWDLSHVLYRLTPGEPTRPLGSAGG